MTNGDSKQMIVGLDIGTSKVVAVVGEIDPDGAMEVVGIGSHPSRGMKKGVVVNIESTVNAIQRAVEEAELMAGCQIHSVYVGIAGSHIRSVNSHGIVAIRDQEVFQQDVDRVIDAAQAVYDWDYARQLLHLRAAEATGESSRQTSEALEAELYDERFLIRRPLLQAIATTTGVPPILLIDEIDRADDEFEAYLLEILSDYQITVPEIGTFRAEQPPLVILTSNRTRDVHDALKRRCLYHWVEHPEVDREVEIVRLRVPDIAPSLATEVAQAVEFIRSLDLYKPPGIAETIDWATALQRLGAINLTTESISSTLGTVVKYREDAERINSTGLDQVVEHASRT